MEHCGLYVPLKDAIDPVRKTSEFWRINDSVLHAMESLGRQCQDADIDIRNSAFWPLLEFQHIWEQWYEAGRVVHVTELTPLTIYQRLSVDNFIFWNGWSIWNGPAGEMEDDYLQPIWDSPVYVQHQGCECKEFAPLSKQLARYIYERLTGLVAPDPETDGLGYDPPHPAEFV